MRQPTFFDRNANESRVNTERLVLYALGDFQARGKVLAERELPLDRLRGALRRAAEAFGVEELSDEQAVASLGTLGAHVTQVQPFVAKHPYRITVQTELAAHALNVYEEIVSTLKSKVPS